MVPSVFTYKGCDSCRKATRWLAAKNITFKEISIRETPPTPTQLRLMLGFVGSDLRRLFNTSGQDYRALALKDKLPALSTDEAIALLAGNGNLIKRPFLLGNDVGLVGFRESDWDAELLP